MKELSPFQRALLEANSKTFADIPDEEHTDLIPSGKFEARVQTIGKKRSSLRRYLRRGLIAAAAVFLLAGVTFAAVRFSLSGKVEKSIYNIPEYEVQNARYDISFQKDIAATDAPDEIQVYMLPTALVSPEDLSMAYCYLEDEDNAWYPHCMDMENNHPIDGKLQTIHTEWSLNGYQVTFTQRTAASVKPGDTVVSIHTAADEQLRTSYETITLGEYEFFCFTTDFSAFEEFSEMEDPVSRFWFWTDGYYLYELLCSPGVTQNQMQQIFESIAPVEDINDYLSLGT